MKDNNYLKKGAIRLVISSLLTYFITIYALGLLLGYQKTIFSFKLSYLMKVVLIEAFLIVMEELIRYIISRNTPHQKLPIIIYTLILAVLNIIIEINGYNLSDNEAKFIFLSTVIVPVLCREAICSYITYKISYVPSLIFKLSIVLYQYIFPIIPNLGNYLYATTNTLLPYVIYILIKKFHDYKDNEKTYHKKANKRLATIPLLTLLIILIILISGVFKHTMIAVGSNSMVPTYERGDAIIYEKRDIKNIKVGEIIAFRKDGRIITHRIISMKNSNNKYTIKTKGDANRTPDAFIVEDKEILGVVKFRIKYIGFPTLWFNDLYTGKGTE